MKHICACNHLSAWWEVFPKLVHSERSCVVGVIPRNGSSVIMPLFSQGAAFRTPCVICLIAEISCNGMHSRPFVVRSVTCMGTCRHERTSLLYHTLKTMCVFIRRNTSATAFARTYTHTHPRTNTHTVCSIGKKC